MEAPLQSRAEGQIIWEDMRSNRANDLPVRVNGFDGEAAPPLEGVYEVPTVFQLR